MKKLETMAGDESQFMRTALPLNGSFKVDDSSLALPSEDKLTHPENQLKHRRNRVGQQVQLALSRKGKRSGATDTARLTYSLSSGQLPINTPVINGAMKVLSSSEYNAESESSRPVRRVDLPSQELPQPNGSYWTSRYGSSGNSFHWRSATSTLPVMRSSSLADRLHTTVSSQRCTYSDTLRNTKHFRSIRSSTLQRPRKPVYEDNPLDDVFVPEGTFAASLRPEHQKVFMDKQTMKKTLTQAREGAFESQDLSWLVHDGGERQVTLRRRPSQIAAMVVMDANANRVAGAEEQKVKKEAVVRSVKRGKQGGDEMTLKMAVNHLSQENTDMQIKAAYFIQNQCFSNADAKKKLFQLHGIPKLLELLNSESEEVQRATSGALRNVVFENNDNKMEVKDSGGIAVILRLLKRNRDIETRRQLTGLLWNLSSHDMLKEHLGRDAVKPLTDNVLVPCSGISEGEDPKLELLADPEVFLNATGCLRNMSSAGPNCRKAMRDCDGLIDSIVYYIRGTIADRKPDDRALENCVCTLHNLTYQFESEVPEKLLPVLKESTQSLAVRPPTPGCFSMRQSSKVAKEDKQLESESLLLEENGNPEGVEWLWSAITIRMYMSLIAISSRQLTQEASIGAMQNLTAGTGGVSQATAHVIVQKGVGLQQVKKLLLEGEPRVRQGSLGLLKNMSRYRELHSDIVKQVLPELAAALPGADTHVEQSTEATLVCQTLNNLSQASVQNVRAVLSHGVLPKLINIGAKGQRDGFTRAGQAASALLHTLWGYSELHSNYKKAGYKKTDFINNATKAANSARD